MIAIILVRTAAGFLHDPACRMHEPYRTALGMTDRQCRPVSRAGLAGRPRAATVSDTRRHSQ
jgi:hypothetical protein